jgi:hypothetical protein
MPCICKWFFGQWFFGPEKAGNGGTWKPPSFGLDLKRD